MGNISYIGIGSNLGEKKKNCEDAIHNLSFEGGNICSCSSFYETSAWGVHNQPSFINLVLKIETELTPYELLHCLKGIEKLLGRKETFRWGPRLIDLDILFYGSHIVKTPNLKIPHCYLHKRLFVLEPMMEIAPDFIHPLIKKSIQELYQELVSSEKIESL
jgi:2-amino-4-hydroxy-6-hydroxymethyldihydropteridine diphosphokinase